MELLLFTKMLDRVGNCSIAETAKLVDELGLDGADLTVRDGGHVDPAAVAEELPAAVDAFADRGLSVPMITTAITSADDAVAREVFAAADACGVEWLKLGYWHYDGFGTVRDGLQRMREDVADIAALGGEFDVTPAVHVHSGPFLTGDSTLLWSVLRDYEPEEVAAYIDPGHMLLEGAAAGWEIGMDLLGPHTRLVAAKDFGLFPRPVIGDGGTTWERRIVPLGDGLVPWDEVAANLAALDFDGPLSIHAEYHVDELSTLTDQIEGDRAYLRSVLADAGLGLD